MEPIVDRVGTGLGTDGLGGIEDHQETFELHVDREGLQRILRAIHPNVFIHEATQAIASASKLEAKEMSKKVKIKAFGISLKICFGQFPFSDEDVGYGISSAFNNAIKLALDTSNPNLCVTELDALLESMNPPQSVGLNGVEFGMVTKAERKEKGMRSNRSIMRCVITKTRDTEVWAVKLMAFPTKMLLGDNSFPAGNDDDWHKRNADIVRLASKLFCELADIRPINSYLNHMQLAFYTGPFENSDQRNRCVSMLDGIYSLAGTGPLGEAFLNRKGFFKMKEMRNRLNKYGGFGIQTKRVVVGFPETSGHFAGRAKRTKKPFMHTTIALQYKDVENEMQGIYHEDPEMNEFLQTRARVDVTLHPFGLWKFCEYVCTKKYPDGSKNPSGELHGRDMAYLKACIEFRGYQEGEGRYNAADCAIPIKFWLSIIKRIRNVHYYNTLLRLYVFEEVLMAKTIMYTNTPNSPHWNDFKAFIQSHAEKKDLPPNKTWKALVNLLYESSSFEVRNPDTHALMEVFGDAYDERSYRRWCDTFRHKFGLDLTIPMGIKRFAINKLLIQHDQQTYRPTGNVQDEFESVADLREHVEGAKADFKHMKRALFYQDKTNINQSVEAPTHAVKKKEKKKK